MFLTEKYKKILALDECIILEQATTGESGIAAGTDSVFCNITKSYSINNGVETTSHPIESEQGSPEITDSIHNMPRVLNLSILLKSVVLPTNPYAVKDFRLTTQERFAKLDNWRATGQLLQIIFDDESEPNMIIKSLTKSITRDAYLGYNLDIVFEEVRIYSSLGGSAIPTRQVNENVLTNRFIA